MKNKVIFCSLTSLLGFSLVFSSASNIKDCNIVEATATTYSDEEKPERYLGYGYDAFGGPIYETTNALHLNYPILNLDALSDKITVINSSKTTYTNSTSSSKKEIAKTLGEESSGGASASAQISAYGASANADLSATFNMKATENWQSVQNETFSYHNIYVQNKTVVFQYDFDNEDPTAFLSSSFLTDAKKVNNDSQAKWFFEKYGTHLMTGYNLGGIFQMTNYYATNSSSYTKEQTTSFETQVSAGLSYASNISASASANYSFSQQYGYKDNNSNATNQYKLSTFGGDAFPGLTIDHAFSYYEPAIGKGGYLYDIWTDSINEGRNTVIVGVPTYSPMIPLYKILPDDGTYREAKVLLLDEYLKETQEAIAEGKKNNKDAIYTDMKYASKEDPAVELDGYDSFSLTDNSDEYYYSTHTLDSKTSAIDVRKGDRVSLNYSAANIDGLGFKWKLKNSSQSSYITPLATDENGETSYGAFEINKNSSVKEGTSISLIYSNGTTTLKEIKLKIDIGYFHGGSGTEEDPYLIANSEELLNINNVDSCMEKHYKLVADIDMAGKTFVPFGKYSTPFTGTFDGEGYSIKNLTIDDTSIEKTGEKAYDDDTFNSYFAGLFVKIGSGGCVKNLTIKKSSIKSTKDRVVYGAGFIAAFSEGDISNCYVKDNCKIDITPTSWTEVEGLSASASVAYVGGLVGCITGGSIDSCGISSSTIILKDHKFIYSYVGSFCGGVKNGNSKIEKCYSKENVVNNEYIGADNDLLHVASSGFIAYVEEINAFENCLAKENQINTKSSGTGTILAGGFLGYSQIESSTTETSYKLLKNVLVYEEGDGKSEITATGSVSYTGVLVACLNSSISMDKLFENVYCYSKDGVKFVGNASDNDVPTAVTRSKTITGFSKDIWSGSSYSTKDLKEHSISNVSFELENVKTDFVVGDSFSIGEMIGTREYDDGGDAENFENFYVDYSEFDSSKAGTYTIKVSAYGYTSEYDVTVRKAEVTSLNATLTEKTYLAGDKFDTSDVAVSACYENGTSKEVDSNDLTFDMNKTLAEGQNKITISYGGASTYVIVTAEAKEIEKFEITKTPTKTKYSTKDKTIDLSGLEVEVTYTNENAESKIVSYDDDKSEFQYYYCGLKEGSNEITVSYADCEGQTIEVEAVKEAVTIDTDLLNAFVDTVNLLDTTTSLESYRNVLIAGKEKRADLQKAYTDEVLSENASYCSANEKLEAGIAKYQEMAKTINEDYEDAIEATGNVSVGALAIGFGSAIIAVSVIIGMIIVL